MPDSVVIDRRFRGPPASANGGYACGRLAAFAPADPAVKVTLWSPPPLEEEMLVERVQGPRGVFSMSAGETLIAEAEPEASPFLSEPGPVAIEEAEAARAESPLHAHHPFEECFVCGPRRAPGDGLRIVCGPVPGREDEVVAAPWETDSWMADANGLIRDELVWAALDCPSGLAGMLVPDLGLSMLGRLTAEILRPPRTGQSYVAIGWPIRREGRKLAAGSAVLDPDGEPLAVARATWIELREKQRGYG